MCAIFVIESTVDVDRAIEQLVEGVESACLAFNGLLASASDASNDDSDKEARTRLLSTMVAAHEQLGRVSGCAQPRLTALVDLYAQRILSAVRDDI